MAGFGCYPLEAGKARHLVSATLNALQRSSSGPWNPARRTRRRASCRLEAMQPLHVERQTHEGPFSPDVLEAPDAESSKSRHLLDPAVGRLGQPLSPCIHTVCAHPRSPYCPTWDMAHLLGRPNKKVSVKPGQLHRGGFLWRRLLAVLQTLAELSSDYCTCTYWNIMPTEQPRQPRYIRVHALVDSDNVQNIPIPATTSIRRTIVPSPTPDCRHRPK